MMLQLGYTPFWCKFILLFMGNEETLTVCNSPCDLARKTPLHQPAKVTHPHRYNTPALFTQWLTLAINTKQGKFGIAHHCKVKHALFDW